MEKIAKESGIKKSFFQKSSLKINAISNWIALGVNIIAGLLLTPLIISHIGKTGYGVWRLIGSFVGYYGLLNLGVASAIMRYIARYASQGDEKAINETSNTALTMFSCTGLLAIVLSFLLASPLAKFFNVSSEYVNEFKFVIYILGIATGVSFPGNVFHTIITAYEKYILANFIKIITTLVRAGLIVLMLLKGLGIIGVAYATLISMIVMAGTNYLACKRFTSVGRFQFKTVKLKVFRELLIYGGSTTVIAIANILRLNIDSIVIGKLVGIAKVAVYGIAALIIRYVLNLIVAGMSVLTPRFAALDGARERAKLQDLFMRSLLVSAVLSFGVCMFIFIFGGRFIVFWVGEGFTDAIPVLWILTIAYAVALSQNPGIGLMYALKKHHFYAAVTIIEAIANVILSILLAPKYGIIGVALGTAIPMLVVKLFVQPIYISGISGITIWNYAKPFILPATMAFIMVILAYNLGIVTEWKGDLTVRSLISFLFISSIYFGVILITSKQFRSYVKRDNSWNPPRV